MPIVTASSALEQIAASPELAAKSENTPWSEAASGMRSLPKITISGGLETPKRYDPDKIHSFRYRAKQHRDLPHVVKFSGGRSSGMLLFALLEKELSRPSKQTPQINMNPNYSSVRQTVREKEILRVAVELQRDSTTSAIEGARREILYWAQRRSGGDLPREAWNGNKFEHLVGGRTVMGIRQMDDSSDVWALRAHDPDKTVAGRNWTIEVAVGKGSETVPLLGVRLLVSTPEDTLDIEPHVPGFLQQIATKDGLFINDYEVKSHPWNVASANDQELLIKMLEDPERTLPVFVASGDERTENPDQPLIDVDILARATIGLAHVVTIPATYTYALSDAFGKLRSTYHGGVRIYMPGFDINSNPYDHILFLSEHLKTDEEKKRCVSTLRMIAARQSLIRTRLNRDVLSFSSLRSSILKTEQERRAQKGASVTNQLETAQQRIEAIEYELKEAKVWEQQLSDEHAQEEEKSRRYKAQLQSANVRIQFLVEQLKNSDKEINTEMSYPQKWSEFADWCEEYLIGQLILTPHARRQVKNPKLKDVSLAARCLLWLASEYRDRRIHGGGSLAEAAIEDGVKNAPCGSDTFRFDFEGDRLDADWHVKNGGNTRDPLRCLRIYYGWDSRSQQIIVADMPAHRRTSAS